MRRATACLILSMLGWRPAFAQPQAQAPSPTRSSPPAQPVYQNPLELPCAKILALGSSDYIARIVAIDDSRVDGQLRGIGRYGACYDTRTDALAASLARRAKGPDKAARADFAAFESALKDFTARALADLPPQPASEKEAYARLYQRQFRYEFYQEYEAKTRPRPAALAAKSSLPAAKTATPAAAPAVLPAPGSAEGVKSGSPPPATAEERARSDADPVTQAKNRFGKLLEALPGDQMHELHGAFGEVIGPHAMSETTRLAVYRYAIFLLETKSAAPFAPPPF